MLSKASRCQNNYFFFGFATGGRLKNVICNINPVIATTTIEVANSVGDRFVNGLGVHSLVTTFRTVISSSELPPDAVTIAEAVKGMKVAINNPRRSTSWLLLGQLLTTC